MGHLVFLDESDVKNNMTRRYGRARNGERCYDSVITDYVLSMTVESPIRLDGTTESFVFEGTLTKEIFETYVKEILAPSLREGDIVIMDNLSSHKSQVAEEVIRSRNAKVLFLSAYRLESHRKDVEQDETAASGNQGKDCRRNLFRHRKSLERRIDSRRSKLVYLLWVMDYLKVELL